MKSVQCYSLSVQALGGGLGADALCLSCDKPPKEQSAAIILVSKLPDMIALDYQCCVVGTGGLAAARSLLGSDSLQAVIQYLGATSLPDGPCGIIHRASPATPKAINF